MSAPGPLGFLGLATSGASEADASGEGLAAACASGGVAGAARLPGAAAGPASSLPCSAAQVSAQRVPQPAALVCWTAPGE